MCFKELEQKQCLLRKISDDDEKLKEIKIFLSKIVLCKSKNKSLLNLPCQVCGYSRKIHLAHIKAICSYPDTALLKEINSEQNNLVLCPNHHSEFDDGYLSIDEIPKRKN